MFKCILLIFFSIAAVFSAHATHLISSQLSCEYVMDIDANTAQYKVQLLVYRNCLEQVPLGVVVTIGVYDKDSNLMKRLNIPLVAKRQLRLEGCSFDSTCTEIGVYEALLHVNKVNTYFFLSFERCCRSYSSNLRESSGGQPDQSFYALLEVQSNTRNKSALLENPVIGICLNDTFNWRPNFSDADGDSVILSLIHPIASPAASLANAVPTPPDNLSKPRLVSYKTSYSVNQPFGNKGFIKALPQNLFRIAVSEPGIYSLALDVKEYRVGALISSRIIDVTITANVCPDQASQEIELFGSFASSTAAALDWNWCGSQEAYSQINKKIDLESVSAFYTLTNHERSYIDTAVEPNHVYHYNVVHYDSNDLLIQSSQWVSIGFGNLNNRIIEPLQLSAYPNPTESVVIMKGVNLSLIGLVTVAGQQIDIPYITNINSLELDLSDLASGVYIAKVATAEGTIQLLRVIKK